MKKTYEEQCESDLEKDDATILEQRYEAALASSNLATVINDDQTIDGVKSNEKVSERKRKRLIKSQWTLIHDGVQEHFSSHVLVNSAAYLLPINIYLLKQSAKKTWVLYKKRECERRKRLRKKMELEKEIESSKGPANLLLSLVDTCEICRKLYVTVNLFWGVTVCDLCYFNPEVITDIMKKHIGEGQPSNVNGSSSSIGESNAGSFVNPRNVIVKPALKRISQTYFEIEDDGNERKRRKQKSLKKRGVDLVEKDIDDIRLEEVNADIIFSVNQSSSSSKINQTRTAAEKSEEEDVDVIVEEEEEGDIREISKYEGIGSVIPSSQRVVFSQYSMLSQLSQIDISKFIEEEYGKYSQVEEDDDESSITLWA